MNLPNLSPAEVCLVQLFLIVLNPPETVLEQRSHHDGVVAFAYEVLIDDTLRRVDKRFFSRNRSIGLLFGDEGVLGLGRVVLV